MGLGAAVWNRRGRRVLRRRKYARRTAIRLSSGRNKRIVRNTARVCCFRNSAEGMGGKRRFRSRKGEGPGPGINGRGKAMEGLERVSKVIAGRKRILSSVESMAIRIKLLSVQGG
jgi:hypothetical protein